MNGYTSIQTPYSSGLPNRVKIGPVEYAVNLVACPKVEKEDGEEVTVYGCVNFKKSEITIDNELTPIMQWQCFWHELFHIIFEQLGLDNDDEGGTDALAYKILEILVDNGFLNVTPVTQFPSRETPEGSLQPVSVCGYSSPWPSIDR